MFKRIYATVCGLVLCSFLLTDAAASVLFTGSGTWDATAETTLVSAPGARWSFSFVLPNAVTVNPTSLLGNFSYALNGSVVGVAPASVEFFNSVDSGMFDIIFSNAVVASFYGPAVWNSPAFLLGSYVVDSGIAGSLPMGSGTISLRAVPEPATWTMLLGSALLGVTYRRKRKVTK